jgi:hypothetical protein
MRVNLELRTVTDLSYSAYRWKKVIGSRLAVGEPIEFIQLIGGTLIMHFGFWDSSKAGTGNRFAVGSDIYFQIIPVRALMFERTHLSTPYIRRNHTHADL